MVKPWLPSSKNIKPNPTRWRILEWKKKMKNEIQNYLGRYWKKSKYEKNEDENEKERDEETKSFWNVQTVPMEQILKNRVENVNNTYR